MSGDRFVGRINLREANEQIWAMINAHQRVWDDRPGTGGAHPHRFCDTFSVELLRARGSAGMRCGSVGRLASELTPDRLPKGLTRYNERLHHSKNRWLFPRELASARTKSSRPSARVAWAKYIAHTTLDWVAMSR
jgi:hypothetical protein